ncbi:hypothetical protein [Novosphingobium beihaiensis]|uniref:Transposase n=1 Tax=Novosphingobium beihaiensis TaxID=2930389 RepID=A0ABT0BJI3_9SPHN|nr:hypothetical protein [Novosphingobium beihaiensis]MCJ2185217.1 hypothetical protein [Novosphingobium beihaiensis]
MGSILSGRRDGKPLVEDCLTLDLAWLMRLGPIREGQAGAGEIKWSRGRNSLASAHFRLDLGGMESPHLLLRYSVPLPDGKLKKVVQKIALTSTEQHFGGRRWWMKCPTSGKRARTLHLPTGGNRFASREAWGLAYRVERLSHFDRPFEKLFRAQRKLGGAGGLGAEVERPKGMWRRTYACHHARIERHDLACVDQIAALIEQA